MAKSTRRSGGPAAAGRRGKDASFEVEDQDAPKKAPPGIETGLVFVTFAALVIGILLAQMELSSSFGKGLLG